MYSKDTKRKLFFKVKKGPLTPNIIGGFYPKELDLYFMIIYPFTWYESNTPIFSNDIERKPFFKVEKGP